MSAPRVSVIINCLNGEKYLREAIDSVFAQTVQDWELIFWDNVSTDATASIAQGYGDQLRYFRAEATTPPGEARSLAFAQARGEFVAILDADDVWLPEKLEQQLPLFDDPEVGVGFCDAVYFNEQGITWRLYRDGPPPQGWVLRRLLRSDFICLSTAIVRRAALVALDHWFDPQLQYVEEYDLFLRLALKWKFAGVWAPLTRYRIHAQNWTSLHPEMQAEETPRGFNNLRRLVPNLDREYGRELAAHERAVRRRRAEAALRRNDRSGCRAAVRPDAPRDWRSGLIFLISFLPLRLYVFLRQRYRHTY